MIKHNRITAPNTLKYSVCLSLVLAICACDQKPPPTPSTSSTSSTSSTPASPSTTTESTTMSDTDPLNKSEQQWKQELTAEQFKVLRKKGTERAFTGELWNNKAAGVYICAGCELELYHSGSKFDSGTGWPSFFEPIDPENVETEVDRSFFSVRTEVHCKRCGGHLGHVFDDGPQPTGLRHCINSAALTFIEEKETENP